MCGGGERLYPVSESQTMMQPILVYNTASRHFYENRIFDRDYAVKFPGAEVWALLGARMKERGWEAMTADAYLRGAPSDPAICISEMETPFTAALLNRRVIPSIIFSGESPNVAWKFYRQLEKYTRPYHYAYVFRGASARVSPNVQTRTFYWPNAIREPLPAPAWLDREYLVMVASNKSRYMVSGNTSYHYLRSFAKKILWDGLRKIDPFFNFEDLYQKRLDAILYFSSVMGFHLYGTGWDGINQVSKYHRAAKRIGAAPVADKLMTMTQFKYALCFENCVFPGYVTEKIFDCFFSGCIPVYWGAPDIADFVPAEAFIDMRQFQNFEEANCFLKKMSSLEANRYIGVARDFLASSAFKKFHQDFWVDELLGILETEFANSI